MQSLSATTDDNDLLAEQGLNPVELGRIHEPTLPQFLKLQA